MNKYDFINLKKENDEKHGGYYKADFDVPVFSTNVSDPKAEEKRETHTLRGYLFKDENDENLFVAMDPFSDGPLSYVSFKESALENPDYKVGEKVTFEQEKKEEEELRKRSKQRNRP